MSRIGRLGPAPEVTPATSEREALRLLKEAQENGHRAHYIRHHRESFSVCVFKEEPNE